MNPMKLKLVKTVEEFLLIWMHERGKEERRGDGKNPFEFAV